ncbi:MAG: hypothetical protein HY769_06975 [Candidatus Stahlbacteria bacterium]|nr:hypothetical protein [Candidatus Stahlbacteria bacterium]
MMVLFLLLGYPEAMPLLDSLSYRYHLHCPDTLNLIAKCSIVPDVEFSVLYVKGDGLEIKKRGEAEDSPFESVAREIINGALLLTGLGASELWQSLGNEKSIDTVFTKDNWITILPKATTLFTKAELKIDNWLIRETKIKTEDQDMYAKIEYKNGLPVNIDVKSDTSNEMSYCSKFIIKQEYKKGSTLRIPYKTEIIGESSEIPDEWKYIVIEYRIVNCKVQIAK